MSSLITQVRGKIESPKYKKFIKYSLTSVVSLTITVLLQVIFYGLFHLKGGMSALAASTIAAFPSYFLNRRWVWGKSGRSHMKKEVIPFWAMVFLGLGVSAGASALGDSVAHSLTDSHALRTGIVVGSSVLAFAILWFGKFIIFNKILFVHRESDLDPVLDGRSGLPT